MKTDTVTTSKPPRIAPKKDGAKAAVTKTTKFTAKKTLKRSANDVFAKADSTLSREYIERVVKAMGRK